MNRFAVGGAVVLVLIAAGTWYVLKQLGEESSVNVVEQAIKRVATSGSEPPLRLKSIGINLAPYDATTGYAGDVQFTKQNLEFERVFMGYGFEVPANSAGPAKSNPQPTFIVPLGTKVHSIVDGVVSAMPTLYSGDVSIMVTDGKNENWVYELEHVMNPLVAVGDRVVAGQVVAEVSDYDAKNTPGFGLYEIGILHGGTSGPPEHVCPFAYLDPSVEANLQASLRQLYTDWEAYWGDTTLYDEAELPIGCVSTDSITG